MTDLREHQHEVDVAPLLLALACEELDHSACPFFISTYFYSLTPRCEHDATHGTGVEDEEEEKCTSHTSSRCEVRTLVSIFAASAELGTGESGVAASTAVFMAGCCEMRYLPV